jgi:alpha-ribazole phosphatase
MDDRVVIGLFRHGLTSANLNKQFCGWTDVSVTEEGLTALREMTVPDYDWIVSSDLVRCMETAAAFWDQPPYKMKSFREFHFGEWEKKKHAELEHIPVYQDWLNDFTIQVPGGDSYTSFALRIEEAFQLVLVEMAEQNIRRTAIVTHGGVIRHLLTIFAPEEKSFSDWTSNNGHGYELSGSLAEMRRGGRCISLQAVPSTEKNNG